jgi:hypothetical protein
MPGHPSNVRFRFSLCPRVFQFSPRRLPSLPPRAAGRLARGSVLWGGKEAMMSSFFTGIRAALLLGTIFLWSGCSSTQNQGAPQGLDSPSSHRGVLSSHASCIAHCAVAQRTERQGCSNDGGEAEDCAEEMRGAFGACVGACPARPEHPECADGGADGGGDDDCDQGEMGEDRNQPPSTDSCEEQCEQSTLAAVHACIAAGGTEDSCEMQARASHQSCDRSCRDGGT